MLHNGKRQREHEPCNGDYLHGEKKIVAVPDSVDYLTGREHHSGSSIDFQVKGIGAWAAAYMFAAHPAYRKEVLIMAEKRKDSRGRNLKTGEYYDYKNKRYMFRKMIDGERITITAPDLVELRKQENDMLCRIDRGNKLNTRNARMTLNAYFDFWMETFAKSGRKATTCTNYKSYYNTYIKNTIGKKQIAKITKADCQRIINEMVQDGKKHSTMSNLKSCLNIVFECALDDDIIIKNPAKNLQVPQTESKKRTAIEQRQIDLFMGYVKNSIRYSYSYPAFVVLFNLGVRIGEMAALTWDDVNFKENTITINKTVNQYRKADYGFTMAIASSKSKTSIRTVTMNSVVRKTLLKLKMQSVPHAANCLMWMIPEISGDIYPAFCS